MTLMSYNIILLHDAGVINNLEELMRLIIVYFKQGQGDGYAANSQRETARGKKDDDFAGCASRILPQRIFGRDDAGYY